MENIGQLILHLFVGAVLHWIFIGPVFDFTSVSSWMIVLGGPIALFLSICLLVLAIIVIYTLVTGSKITFFWDWNK